MCWSACVGRRCLALRPARLVGGPLNPPIFLLTWSPVTAKPALPYPWTLLLCTSVFASHVAALCEQSSSAFSP
jgi:hypothetical protein